MPDAIDGLLDDVGAADNAHRHSISAARILFVDDDQLRCEVEGIAVRWRLIARLWQPRLALSAPHTHDIARQETGQEQMHDHSVPATETLPDEAHSHRIEYREGDIGLLLRVGGALPLFIGGLVGEPPSVAAPVPAPPPTPSTPTPPATPTPPSGGGPPPINPFAPRLILSAQPYEVQYSVAAATALDYDIAITNEQNQPVLSLPAGWSLTLDSPLPANFALNGLTISGLLLPTFPPAGPTITRTLTLQRTETGRLRQTQTLTIRIVA